MVTVLTTPGTVAAQERTTFHAGDRLRVHTRVPPSTVVGRLVFIGSHSVTLDVIGSGRVTLRASSIDRVDVSRGRDPLLAYGAPVVGAIVGALIGSTLSTPVRCRFGDGTDSGCNPVVSDPVIGAVWGGILAGVAGRVIGRERWADVDLGFQSDAEISRVLIALIY